MTDFHPSAMSVLGDLRRRYPDTPFLALGQTIWWDEPMKAVLCRMLERLGLNGSMVLGVHDTDYFAKARVRQAGQSRFELMPHNDGSTKDLWSAAGEISRLWGSETFPRRADYLAHEVGLGKAARAQGGDRQDFVNEVTEAWGWRGLIYTGSRDLTVHRMPLADVGDAIEQMLAWGFEGTTESVSDECCRFESQQTAAILLSWVREFRASRPDAMLTDLYQALFPKLLNRLLGSAPRNVTTDCTTHLLRLNTETASLPRFELVDLFLNERTRAQAAAAYNAAIAGGEMYTLDRFGLGAVPFDVILKDHGRGTLRVTLRAIHIETRKPLRIPLSRPINGVRDLAEVLTSQFGSEVTLVGKAVALISMLAREFIFVFNEEGSGYVTRTLKMNDLLRAGGAPLPMHPILRLRYHTWDALDEAHVTLNLPDHLEAAFGRRVLPAQDFSRSWRTVVTEQQHLLDRIRELRQPRALLEFLAAGSFREWGDCIACYDGSKATLRNLREIAANIQEEVLLHYATLAEIKTDIRETEKAKGDHFRATREWTPSETRRRSGYDEHIAGLLEARRDTLARIQALKARRMAVERGPEATPARAEIARIEAAAELQRLKIVRNAILTSSGLVHTGHRPTAWWLPMVDPSGSWFRRIVETTEVYTQPLISDQ